VGSFWLGHYDAGFLMDGYNIAYIPVGEVTCFPGCAAMNRVVRGEGIEEGGLVMRMAFFVDASQSKEGKGGVANSRAPANMK